MKTLHLSLAALAAALALPASAQDVQALLRQADAMRSGGPGRQIETLVEQLDAQGQPLKERRYTVLSQSQHRSLVLMRSPAEKGQKVLMLGDDFWLLMPGSQRPMRITPMQKLLGDASTGDIATLSWAEDYEGELRGEARCGEQVCLHLSLQARRRGVSYQRIELWLGKRHAEPIKAELYVQSDKLAKRAAFSVDDISAPRQVLEMRLTDALAAGRETRVRYLGQRPRSMPEAWFNPMFLAQNPGLELAP